MDINSKVIVKGDGKSGIYSLFIGRWQPFHDGHKALVETVLDKGGSVCIGIRETAISFENPHTVEERKSQIRESLQKWFYRERIKMIAMPDIGEVVIGRKVGYDIREVSLDQDTEAISGTKIREQKSNDKS